MVFAGGQKHRQCGDIHSPVRQCCPGSLLAAAVSFTERWPQYGGHSRSMVTVAPWSQSLHGHSLLPCDSVSVCRLDMQFPLLHRHSHLVRDQCVIMTRREHPVVCSQSQGKMQSLRISFAMLRCLSPCTRSALTPERCLPGIHRGM